MTVSRETSGTARLCSRCPNEARPGQRYCRSCHAEAQRRYHDDKVQRLRTDAWTKSRSRLAEATAEWERPAIHVKLGPVVERTRHGWPEGNQ